MESATILPHGMTLPDALIKYTGSSLEGEECGGQHQSYSDNWTVDSMASGVHTPVSNAYWHNSRNCWSIMDADWELVSK